MINLVGLVTATAVFWSAAASAQRRSDYTQTMLTTIYQGDVKRTKETMEKLAKNYAKFLEDFVSNPYCMKESPGTVQEGCKKLRREELNLIAAGSWSEAFNLGDADFNQSFGVYNFVKPLFITAFHTCKFTLQITADLNAQALINDEFVANCAFK